MNSYDSEGTDGAEGADDREPKQPGDRLDKAAQDPSEQAERRSVGRRGPAGPLSPPMPAPGADDGERATSEGVGRAPGESGRLGDPAGSDGHSVPSPTGSSARTPGVGADAEGARRTLAAAERRGAGANGTNGDTDNAGDTDKAGDAGNIRAAEGIPEKGAVAGGGSGEGDRDAGRRGASAGESDDPGPSPSAPVATGATAPLRPRGTHISDSAPVAERLHWPSSPPPAPAAIQIPGQQALPTPATPPSERGIAGLSRPYQAVLGAALALVVLLTCTHVAMVFLHVAPSNTVTKQYGKAVDAWIYPEFEQNWKLFAPNPLQQNVAVQVKAEVRTAQGERKVTDWIDLTAQDREAIRGNLLPSHVQQNELRRAWDLYVNSHDDQNRATGLRGRLSEGYLRRIAMLRFDAQDLGGSVERIRFRSSTVLVDAPEWSEEQTDTRPVYRELPWWTVTAEDRPGGAEAEAVARVAGGGRPGEVEVGAARIARTEAGE